MSPTLDLLLALGVPLLTMLGVLIMTALMEPEAGSLAPARGSPLRRRTAARFRTVGSTLAFTCWALALGGKILRLRDDDRWLEWFYAIVGLAAWLLGWLDGA